MDAFEIFANVITLLFTVAEWGGGVLLHDTLDS